jgi:cell division protein FtsQ
MTALPLEPTASDAAPTGQRAPRGAADDRRPTGGRRLLRRAGQALALGLVLTAPWWGRAALRRLDYFRVRAVQVHGARYLDAADVVERLGVDTTRSIWDELAPLERRVAEHPQVRAARIERGLPGTLRVHVDERLPVAFVPEAAGLRVVAADGRSLPIDASRQAVDLPIVSHADTAVLRFVAELRDIEPALYRQVSEVRRAGPDDVVLRLVAGTVRVRPSAGARRLAEIRHVEADLARRAVRAAELDLRFRDQVIARLP